MLNVPRSVVDDRQPYFVVGGHVLTVNERMKLVEECNCGHCNGTLTKSKIQGELNDPRSK